MMIFRSRTAAALAGAAALSLAATPAMARGWGRHHDDGIDAGDVFAGLLVVGGIAAIAAAASSKAKKDRQAREDARYRDDNRADGYRPDDYRAQDYRAGDYRDAPAADYGSSQGAPPATDYGVARRDPPPADYGAGRTDDQAIDYGDVDHRDSAREAPAAPDRSAYGVDAAVDACVGEVERSSRSVETIDGVNREGQGWRVGGRYTGGYGFSCVVDAKGRVKSVEGL